MHSANTMTFEQNPKHVNGLKSPTVIVIGITLDAIPTRGGFP